MAIVRLPDGRYQIRYFESGTKKGRRCQETLPAGTKRKEAEKVYKRRLSAAADLRAREETFERMTFKKLSDEYLVKGTQHLAEGTQLRTEESLRLHLLPVFGHQAVDSIRALHVMEYQTKRTREEQAAPATVNREVGVLRTILNWGETHELIDRNPIRRKAVRPLKEDNVRLDFFEPEEWRRFLQGFEDDRAWRAYLSSVRSIRRGEDGAEYGPGGIKPDSDAAAEYRDRLREFVPVFRALLYSGSRIGEILTLTWDRVDYRRGAVNIYQQKTRRDKPIPMTAELRALLQQQRQGIGRALVFVRRNGETFNQVGAQHAFAVALKLAGIDKPLTLHSTRHTVGSWLTIVGVSERHISEILGHAVQGITAKRYAHLRTNSLLPALERLCRVEEVGFEDAEGAAGAADGCRVEPIRTIETP